MMHPDRIQKIINQYPILQKKYVLYWMQQSQRVHYNHALNYAIAIANEHQLPVLVYFCVDANYPEANLRHFQFMLEGIYEVKNLLHKLGISFIIELGNPVQEIKKYLKDSSIVICDRGYTAIQRKWRMELFQLLQSEYAINCHMIESDLIVPIQKASDKCEYGAYTIRPKLMKQYLQYRDFSNLLVVSNQRPLFQTHDITSMSMSELMSHLDVDRTVTPSYLYKGGYLEASRRINSFITKDLCDYPNSSDPSKNNTSKMSMYLHFGQISSLEILDRIILSYDMHQITKSEYDAFVEQLLVRRELAFNYVYYNPKYDDFDGMTEPWAYQTMNHHRFDERPYVYTTHQMEQASTHDIYFNAAMEEMVHTGFMQNYMRMYWAKKIIEWSLSFEEAYDRIKYLNNKYFIDGRDPNSYTGIAWCFGKHDRPWQERNLFGKLRYMNDSGLKRKFDMETYIEMVKQLKRNISDIGTS